MFGYDDNGRLITAGDVAFTRDAEGRITNTAQGISPTRNCGATYDAAGRLKTVTYPSGLVVTYTYDLRGLLSKVEDSRGTSVNFTHDGDGRIVSLARSNGVTDTFTYDAAGRITRVQTAGSIDLKYTRNAGGQITQVDQTGGLVRTVQDAVASFKRDAAGQAAGYKYDGRGRVIEKPAPNAATCTWNGASECVAVNADTCGYNALGDLNTCTVGGQTTDYCRNYAICEGPIVCEFEGATSHDYVCMPTGECVWRNDNAAAPGQGVDFYCHDANASTCALLNEQGTVTDLYCYGPFGEAGQHTGNSDQPFTFRALDGVMSRLERVFLDGGGGAFDDAIDFGNVPRIEIGFTSPSDEPEAVTVSGNTLTGIRVDADFELILAEPTDSEDDPNDPNAGRRHRRELFQTGLRSVGDPVSDKFLVHLANQLGPDDEALGFEADLRNLVDIVAIIKTVQQVELAVDADFGRDSVPDPNREPTMTAANWFGPVGTPKFDAGGLYYDYDLPVDITANETRLPRSEVRRQYYESLQNAAKELRLDFGKFATPAGAEASEDWRGGNLPVPEGVPIDFKSSPTLSNGTRLE
jgi:YD repeat-containing protein